MSEDLKKCPFCNNKLEVNPIHENWHPFIGKFYFSCETCGIRSKGYNTLSEMAKEYERIGKKYKVE